ncbi:HAD family hydrolase [Fervidobacterium thailandense]|uniref:HAD family hydrolase n=1 Tax=Fervidobacterium thailandense TaxID=1008305 RepID=A0A1E3G443_9BACT|nr:HAD family hydrolase [Fervidobacterium thailandense]
MLDDARVIEVDDGSLERVKNCKLFILDIDGTFYLSGKPFDGSKLFYETVLKKGCRLVFLTNNSNKSIDSYLEEFRRLGFQLSREQIVTAGVATAEYLLEEFGPKRVYVVGTEEIKEEFRRVGHTVVEDDPEIVVVTFDLMLTYEKIRKATIFVSRGALFVVTNPDLNCPSVDGPLPDAGAIASVVRKASGVYPNIVFGKPEPRLIDMIIRHHGLSPNETCVVGDRIYTDILAGIRSGTLTVLVLTGEATAEDGLRGPVKPHIIVQDIGTLAKIIS